MMHPAVFPTGLLPTYGCLLPSNGFINYADQKYPQNNGFMSQQQLQQLEFLLSESRPEMIQPMLHISAATSPDTLIISPSLLAELTVPEERKHRSCPIKSNQSAFTDFAEFKTTIINRTYSNSPAMAVHEAFQIQQQQFDALQSNNNSDNSIRKKPSIFSTSSSQPECPLPIRPLASNPLTSTFLGTNWMNAANWNLLTANTLRSPSSAATAIGVAADNSATPTHAASGTDHKQWSSPSSVESFMHKTQTGDLNTIDPVGSDGNDCSSASSTCTQAMMSSPCVVSGPFANYAAAVATAAAAAQPTVRQIFSQAISQGLDMDAHHMPKAQTGRGRGNHGKESAHRVPSVRKVRQKTVSDDYVKQLRVKQAEKNSEETVIPVPQALKADPNFVAISEAQIIASVTGTRRFEDMDPREATTQLCKKLAEKRVFGPRLMAETTVAGPNHSTYENLPERGIFYIKDVCERVMAGRLKNEEEFWSAFKEAMRKLAARCRRVRHARKTKQNREVQHAQQAALAEAARKHHQAQTSFIDSRNEWPKLDQKDNDSASEPMDAKSRPNNPLTSFLDARADWTAFTAPNAAPASDNSPNLPSHSQLNASVNALVGVLKFECQ